MRSDPVCPYFQLGGPDPKETVIKQSMKIGSKQQTIGDFISAGCAVFHDVRGLKRAHGALPTLPLKPCGSHVVFLGPGLDRGLAAILEIGSAGVIQRWRANLSSCPS